MPHLLVALDFSLSKPRQIVIAGKIDPPSPNASPARTSGATSSEETRALLQEVHRHFLPNKVLILAEGGAGQEFFAEKTEAIGAMSMVDGKPAAYVCENFTCKAPLTDAKTLGNLLSAR